MASINRYYSYDKLAPADYSFKLPLDILGKTLTSLQDKSDKNYAELSQLPGLIHTQALTGYDTTRRNQIEQGYKDQIDKLVSSANGDYSNITKGIYGLKANLQRDLTTGDLAAIGSNYKTYADFQKETLAQKDLPRSYADAALRKTLEEYNAAGGYGQIDPITGNYRQVNPIRGQGYDIQGKLAKIGEFKPMSVEEEKRFKEGDWYRNRTISKEYVGLDRVQKSMLAELTNDPLFQEHSNYRQRIGNPITMPEIIGIVNAEAQRRAYTKDKDTSEWQFDQNKAIEAANERARLARAQSDKQHADLTDPYFGRQNTIGMGVTGNYPDKLDFSGMLIDTKTGKAGSNTNFVPGQFYPSGQWNKDVKRMSGKESLNFSNPAIANNPLGKEALSAAYIANGGNKNINNLPKEQQDKLLSDWENKVGKKTAQDMVANMYDNLKSTYNQRELKQNQLAGGARKAESSQLIALRNSVRLADTQTGQALGSLNDVVTAMGGDLSGANTSKGKEGNVSIDVTGDRNGQRVATITVGSKTRQVFVSNFDQGKEQHYAGLNEFTQHKGTNYMDPLSGEKVSTAFSGAMLRNNGSGNVSTTNRSVLDLHGDNKRPVFKTETTNLREGDVTPQGLTITKIASQNGTPVVQLQLPDGSSIWSEWLQEDRVKQAKQSTDKTLQKRTKSSLYFNEIDYTRGFNSALQEDDAN